MSQAIVIALGEIFCVTVNRDSCLNRYNCVTAYRDCFLIDKTVLQSI